MNINYSLLKSRTFWLIVVNFVVAGGNAIVPMIPLEAQTIVTGILGFLAVYTHTHPSQTYNPPQA